MAINKNHEFEELNGVKCGIVERNVSGDRTEFLKKILQFNGFTVIVVPTAAPKVATVPIAAEGEPLPPLPAGPETFTIGVTDYTYNTINAIFGRLLKTADGHVITLAYWHQKEAVSHDEIPYFEDKGDK